MNLSEVLEKQKKYEAARDTFPEMTITSYEKAFEIEFAHNSTAIEGNTLTLMETKVVLEDGIAIGGKSLREIYEVVNHKKAYQYVKDCIKESLALDEKIVKDIHALLMENILTGGIYRREEVVISGASHTPPAGNDMYAQIKNFYVELAEKSSLNGIELAAWTHAEFVRIHPFLDVNGRTSRLLMNYQLLKNGFLPVSVAKEDRLDYYNALDKYAAEGDLQPFMELVATLEEKQLDKYLAHVQEQEMKAPTQTM
ncbi:Fic family protein [Agathobacter sp.]|uniref:Fic family protein n=1 Tax=Agathobacter sp. TaxID=2021311 RepID=UPI003FD7D448